ncbi:hypothetical protein K7X08_036423 [Anisodus acutangulus]|uniref:Uncharacterized protein n=1 Tax=Anisodus acutangulus TaxID=402998 RepID=A0A9Q1QWU8_9SOLA|nr:hypothetical protein K7X08_036423 [Anisodus acutangulus]
MVVNQLSGLDPLATSRPSEANSVMIENPPLAFVWNRKTITLKQKIYRGRYSTVSNHARVSFLSLNCLSKKFDFNQGAQIQKVLKSSKSRRLYVIPNSTDGYPSRSVSEEDTTASKKDTSTVEEWENGGETLLSKWSPPREFTRLGLNRSVGGVLALAFSRELSPVVTAVVVAGRIGSAFAAELGTMQGAGDSLRNCV